MSGPKFKIGDRLRVKTNGYGFSLRQIGSIVTVSRIGTYYRDRIGYAIEEADQYVGGTTLGNPANTVYDGMNGENSFELVESAKPDKLVVLLDESIQKLIDKVNQSKAQYRQAQKELSKAQAVAAYIETLQNS